MFLSLTRSQVLPDGEEAHGGVGQVEVRVHLELCDLVGHVQEGLGVHGGGGGVVLPLLEIRERPRRSLLLSRRSRRRAAGGPVQRRRRRRRRRRRLWSVGLFLFFPFSLLFLLREGKLLFSCFGLLAFLPWAESGGTGIKHETRLKRRDRGAYLGKSSHLLMLWVH